jgi:endonuclease/exonuclease/phosphatase family metal-dependent hydrolase
MSLMRPGRFLVCALCVGALATLLTGCIPTGTAPTAPPEGYLFCFWNCENLFDDKDHGYHEEPDRTYDSWFAEDVKARQLKYDNLARVLAALNNGNGPDILALAEVEPNDRTIELLRDNLNARLKDPKLHYKDFALKDPKGGRAIATAVLTRLPLLANRTHLLGRRLRILETHIEVQGHELVVIASHWTSRVSDKTGDGRDKYADQIYGDYKAMFTANPKVAFLACGDCNDNPDDDSVLKNLHAVGDRDKVRRSTAAEPFLFNLMAKKWDDHEEMTHYYSGRKFVFDQIFVSPAMLGDHGWICVPDSVEIVANEHTTITQRSGRRLKIPFAFGNKRETGERGCSDHLPVTVRLKVVP